MDKFLDDRQVKANLESKKANPKRTKLEVEGQDVCYGIVMGTRFQAHIKKHNAKKAYDAAGGTSSQGAKKSLYDTAKATANRLDRAFNTGTEDVLVKPTKPTTAQKEQLLESMRIYKNPWRRKAHVLQR